MREKIDLRIKENVGPKVLSRVGSEKEGIIIRRGEVGAHGPMEVLQENKDTESACISS